MATYNGWTNYETWVTALWIDNDQGLQEQAIEKATAAREAGPKTLMAGIVRDVSRQLADDIETWVKDDLLPDLGACLAADLLGAAVSEVNFQEIAENWLQDLPPVESDDDETEGVES